MAHGDTIGFMVVEERQPTRTHPVKTPSSSRLSEADQTLLCGNSAGLPRHAEKARKDLSGLPSQSAGFSPQTSPQSIFATPSHDPSAGSNRKLLRYPGTRLVRAPYTAVTERVSSTSFAFYGSTGTVADFSATGQTITVQLEAGGHIRLVDSRGIVRSQATGPNVGSSLRVTSSSYA
jgi:hypothetical protein